MVLGRCLVFMLIMPWLPNGLELSCPAEAGTHARIVRLVGGQDKHPKGPAHWVSRRFW